MDGGELRQKSCPCGSVDPGCWEIGNHSQSADARLDLNRESVLCVTFDVHGGFAFLNIVTLQGFLFQEA